MMLDDLRARFQSPIFLREAQNEDLATISAIHSQSFAHGWSDGEIEQLLINRHTNCAVAEQRKFWSGKRVIGFCIVRVIDEEAEILSVAVDRRSRGNGTGRRLVEDTLRQLAYDGVTSLFLEVDQNNTPAVSLYQRLGFAQVGQREGYYRDATGNRHTAVVMERKLA